jgi:UPF0716 family protein affecting phage T7 exclusion
MNSASGKIILIISTLLICPGVFSRIIVFFSILAFSTMKLKNDVTNFALDLL